MAYSLIRGLTIDHTKCGSTDSSNFPVLFAGTYSWLATVANGGDVQNSNGYDIAFASDSGGATMLSWEIDSYNATTGEVAFWVKVPTVSHTTDTVFYILYGDAGISTLQSTASGVWDSNYVAVTHFSDSSGLTANDSTSNGNNGVVTGITVAPGSKIGTAAAFDGVSSHAVKLPNSTSLNLTSAFTLEAWVYPTATGTYQGIITRATNSSSRNYEYYLAPTTTQMYVSIGGFDDGPLTISTAWATNTWNHVVFAFNGYAASGLHGAYNLYLNGVVVYNNPSFTADPNSTSNDVYYGNELGNSLPLSGRMDECRISASLRSADWILTQYNNQSSPSTFYTVGSASAVVSAAGAQPCFFLCM